MKLSSLKASTDRLYLGTCRNESFSFPAGPSTPKLHVKVYDHKTLGKDKSVGEADVDVSQPLSRLSPL